jgi:hypothetical protein
MVILFGTALFGRCDFVPGRMHVATRFLALFFMPVVPLHGFIVIEEPGRLPRMIQIPISLKSLLLAWARLALGLGGFVMTALGLIWTANYFFGRQPMPLGTSLGTLAAGLAVATVACVVAQIRPKASFLRALQLALAADVDPATVAADFGQPLPEAAIREKLLADIRPVDDDGKADFGTVGRIGSFLVLAGIGGSLIYWGGGKLLREGHRGWGPSFLWALPIALGIEVVLGGFVSLFRIRKPIREKFIWLSAAVFLIAGVFGPQISPAYLGPDEMKRYDEGRRRSLEFEERVRKESEEIRQKQKMNQPNP